MQWFVIVVFIFAGFGLCKLGENIQKDAKAETVSEDPDYAAAGAGGCFVLVGWILLVMGFGGIFISGS